MAEREITLPRSQLSPAPDPQAADQARREEFDSFLRERIEPDWVLELRRRAFQRFLSLPWPTPQEEEWRRTDVTDIDWSRYRVAGSPARLPGTGSGTAEGEAVLAEAADTETAEAAGALTKGAGALTEAAGRATFTGSAHLALYLERESAERGVIFTNLEQAVREQGRTLKDLLGQGLEGLDNRFQAWHYSFWSHGVYLYVPPFVELSRPFILDFIQEDRSADRHPEGAEKPLSSPRVVIFLDRGARATVVQRLIGSGGGELLCNSGVELWVSEAAGLDYYALQNLNQDSLYIAHGSAAVGRDAHLRHLDVSLGSRLLKSRFDCSLEDKGSEAFLDGLYFSHRKQHMDIRSVQRHRSPQANSRAFYKGAVKDQARTIYQGLIQVSPLAAKTDAYLTNKNLILNDGARADSIPSLQIDTNDVKCSHGSTTGRVNDQERFYLMSRGLSLREAEEMLVLGYFEELLERTPAFLGEELRQLIRERLAQAD